MSAISAFTHKPLPDNSPFEAVDPFLLVATETSSGDGAEGAAGTEGEAGAESQTGTPSETHSETGAHGADHGGEKVFPPFDSSTFASQLFWLAITFGLFYYLMAKIIIPRIGQTLEQRHDRIANDLSEAERLKGETDAAIAAYEQALADAKAKAGEIAKSTRDEVQKSIEADRHTAETSIAKKLDEAEAKIAGIKETALGEVDGIAQETAEAIISTLSGVKATKSDLTKAIAEARGS
ncbi:MAG: F0F1 ATP synthase subunit B [Pseudomonadota bacterium]